VPPAILVLKQGTLRVVDLSAIVEYAGYEHDGYGMVCACLFPSSEEFREKRVDNFLIVTFTIPGKLPELATDLNEDHNLCRQRTIDGLCGGCHECAGDLEGNIEEVNR
jgi:hypothetical protein